MTGNRHDPNVQAHRYRRRLRFVHNPRTRVAVRAVSIGCGVAVGMLRSVPVTVTALAVLSVVCGYALTAGHTHRQLEPWCPLCRHRGGSGDTTYIPEPNPIRRASR